MHRKMVVFFRTLKMIYIVCCGMQCVYVFIASECRRRISYALLGIANCICPSTYQKLVWLQIAVVQSGKSQLNDTLWMFLCKS